MSDFSILRCLSTVTLAAFLLMGCQPPMENPKITTTEDVEKPAVKPSTVEEAPDPDPAPEVPREIPDSEKRWPTLSIIEDESANSIQFTGEMASQNQMERLISELSKRLPEVEMIDEVTYDPAIRLTNWGNRADMLWLPFFQDVENGIWEYDDGVTRMKGKTNKRASQSLHRYTPDIMEGRDAKGIDNQLVTE